MALQTAQNLLVAYKPEVTFNVPVSGAGANRFRANPSGGLNLSQAEITSNEIRSDGMTSIHRYGSKSVTGGFDGDASVGSYDPLIEATIRGTWTPAVSITQATMTSITTTSSTIVAAAGSWLTQGVRVGDVVRLTGHSTVANNNRNLRVTAVTATVITVAETLTADAVADTSFTLTILKKLTMPSVPVRRSFTFETYLNDIDVTEQASGVRAASWRIAGGPDAMATFGFGLVGADLIPVAAGASPIFSSPTLSQTIGLTMVDASIRFGGADVTNLTGVDISFDNGASGVPVVGSKVTPDIFENNAAVTGTITGLQTDLSFLTNAVNETELELHVLLVEPESEPKDCISVFIPRLKIQAPQGGIGGNGPRIRSVAFRAGAKGTATGYDDTMLTVSTSAA